ncbi:hypothetical protein ROZALSC1DRAFT_23270 [Rozella allomycis CSF55]|uniref:Uncharacterized protein n=1 Tax=Rozella allomycis (strain CSF55) TaxID=988480 RepID=A0A4P9YFZ2_ROZAC|nr:hypothetical protein ROZALSC1DRAFT_23270 [Rozella allomycis CSF55]
MYVELTEKFPGIVTPRPLMSLLRFASAFAKFYNSAVVSFDHLNESKFLIHQGLEKIATKEEENNLLDEMTTNLKIIYRRRWTKDALVARKISAPWFEQIDIDISASGLKETKNGAREIKPILTREINKLRNSRPNCLTGVEVKNVKCRKREVLECVNAVLKNSYIYVYSDDIGVHRKDVLKIEPKSKE